MTTEEAKKKDDDIKNNKFYKILSDDKLTTEQKTAAVMAVAKKYKEYIEYLQSDGEEISGEESAKTDRRSLEEALREAAQRSQPPSAKPLKSYPQPKRRQY